MSKNKTHKPPKHQPRGRGNTTATTATSHSHRERGGLLTAAILFIVVHGIFITLVAYIDLTDNDLDVRSLYLPILFLTSALDVVGGVAMWFWKKWGFYLYIGASLVAATSALMNTGSILVLFAAILPPIIVAYVVLPKQHLFD